MHTQDPAAFYVSFGTAFDLQPVMSHRFTKSAAGESLKEMKTTEVPFTIVLRWLFRDEPFQEWPVCDCRTCIMGHFLRRVRFSSVGLSPVVRGRYSPAQF